MAEAKHPRKTKTVQNEADELRRGAEERLDRLSDVADSASPALDDVAAIVHDLRVHQIELEMQNQELRRAQLDLEASHKKYFELFDLAPVGYLTLSRESIVRDANLTAARLLGVDRRQLVKKPFTAFICAPDQDVFYRHQQMLKRTAEPQTCELRLKRAAGEADAETALGQFWAHLEGRPHAADGATRLFSVTFADITERKQAERELRLSEAKFSAAFHASPDLMTITRLSDGLLLEVNEGFTHLLGYERAETVGTTTAELSIWADPQARDAFVASLEASGETGATETVLRRKDGTMITGVHSARSMEVEGEASILSVVHDITERKQVEEALRQSAAHLRTLINTLPDLAWLKDPEGVYLSCNRRFESFFGAAVKDIIGKTDYDFTNADQANSFRQHDAAAMAAGSLTVNEEEVVFAKDGHVEILETIKTPVHDGDGRLIGVLGVGRDITARKQAEEALRESEERHRDILENGGVGVAYFSLDGHFLLLNRRAVQNMGGNEASEFVGKSVTEAFGEKAGGMYLERFREAAASPEALEYVDQVDLPGGPRWLASIHTRSLDAAGNAIGVHVYAQDITERTQAEEEVRRQTEQLQRTVEGAVLAMSRMVESRDPYTAGHERRVAELATAIGKELGITGAELDALRLAATIHDIGKIAVPAEILAKPGRLSEIEFSLIKAHPTTGFDILADVDFESPVAEMVRQHHERLDGSGYPRSIAGEEIILEARILAVADVVEAMSSHRPYRPALGMEAALAEVREHAGVKFDADVVAVCSRLVEEQGFQFTP